VRLNKAIVRNRWQATVYAEVLNAFNSRNVRFEDISGFDAQRVRRKYGERTSSPW